MTISLGIDTGGTYTDAVLVDQESGAVIAAAKALTTYHDLSIGIRESVQAVLAESTIVPDRIAVVGLSTTLATNAIVEGRGSPIALLLVGYDPELIEQYHFEQDLVTENVVYIDGGHNGAGDEQRPLDAESAREAILSFRERVEAFAVSGYFAVRNPDHELRLRALIEEYTRSSNGEPLPVTCGHELTTRLNAVRRATTVALNARLIPLLRELIGTVQASLDNLEIAAPLMVVKGDGSLVRATWAMQRPIETILSGPAASAVGACYLAKCDDAWVVDVGGTTTDIAVLCEGHPLLNVEGARVGRWRTMVEAVDAHTVGLGGDSWVRFDEERRLRVGPQRVIPLCALAGEYPQVVKELEEQIEMGQHLLFPGQFALAQRRETVGLAEEERTLLAYLAEPRSLNDVLSTVRYSWALDRRLGTLQERRLVVRAGFTPTDALHVLGRFVQWNEQAARLGAQLLAAQADMPVEDFCEGVVSAVSARVSTELVSKVLGDEGSLPDWEGEPTAKALLDRALGKVPFSGLEFRVSLRRPVVAVGAPVEAYLPQSVRQLGTDLHIPPRAAVANAVGAVAGGVVLQQRVQILPLDTTGDFRLHLPERVYDFGSVEEAVAHAEREMPPYMESLARQAGAEQVEVRVTRVDHNAPVKAGWGQHIYLGTELFYRAVGRPSPTRLR